MKIELPDAPDCDLEGHGRMYWAYEIAGVRENKTVWRCNRCGAEKSTIIKREQ